MKYRDVGFVKWTGTRFRQAAPGWAAAALAMVLVLVLVLATGGACGGGGAIGGDGGGDVRADADVGTGGAGGAGTDGGADASRDLAGCPSFASMTIWSLCTTCHSISRTDADRNLAPAGVDFDVYDSAFRNGELAQSYVFINFMPPPTEPQPTQIQRDALDAWVLCGKPR